MKCVALITARLGLKFVFQSLPQNACNKVDGIVQLNTISATRCSNKYA